MMCVCILQLGPNEIRTIISDCWLQPNNKFSVDGKTSNTNFSLSDPFTRHSSYDTCTFLHCLIRMWLSVPGNGHIKFTSTYRYDWLFWSIPLWLDLLWYRYYWCLWVCPACRTFYFLFEIKSRLISKIRRPLAHTKFGSNTFSLHPISHYGAALNNAWYYSNFDQINKMPSPHEDFTIWLDWNNKDKVQHHRKHRTSWQVCLKSASKFVWSFIQYTADIV